MSDVVVLNPGEKLILLMLCELYDRLKIESDINHDLIREAISTGNLWSLRWSFPDVFSNPPVSEQVLSETIDILNMWRRLEESYNGLSSEEQERVKSQEGGYVPFYGFDNNNEGTYINTAHFLMNKLDRFDNFKGRSLDAHMPTIDTHRRMLHVFEPILRQVSNKDFNADQIAAVMLARIYPEARLA